MTFPAGLFHLCGSSTSSPGWANPWFRFPILLLLVACQFSAVANAEPPALGRLANLELQDIRGGKHSYTDLAKSQLVVFAFLGTECPLAKLYATRLQQLSEAYPAEQVRFVCVNANIQDSLAEIAQFSEKHKLSLLQIKDANHQLADLLGAKRTPEVVVVDRQQQIRYQGRIDDQYQIGVVRQGASREDLKIALDELLAGQPVSVSRTEGIGCLIGRTREPNGSSEVTYSNQIARIFQAHCVDCHHKGDIGPFDMTTYEEVRGWGETIAEVVTQNRMPPWFADPEHGKFVNDCSLNEEQKQLIVTWVRNGCPEGDPQELPEPKVFVEGWQLGRVPDRVVPITDKPYTIPADAGPKGVKYQYFWADPQLKEDLWVKGIELRPGNRAVVHHIIAFLHPEGKGSKKAVFLAGYVPGLRLENGLPPGAAKKIPAGSWIRFQVHYTPIGVEQQDLSSLGLLEARPEEVTHEVITADVSNPGIELQPYLANQTFKGRSPIFRRDVQLISMAPHMHVRGQSFRFEYISPDEQVTTLLNVPKYDFNWQTRYATATPISIEAGSRIRCVAQFDNSAQNPANPDPSKTVKWGDQTWDEMLIGYFDLIFPKGTAEQQPLFNPSTATLERIDLEEGFSMLDKDRDGFLSPEEAKRFPVLEKGFFLIDTNGDGQLDPQELAEAIQKYTRSR
ncbi:redoxin domain-containing protein [Planctomicrobium sp. SH664]|uniref:redoxin domain-containing protein n=1 Tax=Planctomicrobium sp. SH664 TaxID=3448125 RepID=UPI003F5B188E